MTGRRRSSTATAAELAARMAAVDGDEPDQAAEPTPPPTTTGPPQLRTSAGADQAAGQPSARQAEPATRPPAPPVRTRPVRTTVELSPIEHAKLKAWCAQAAADLGVPLVAGAEVFRALWALMRDDPELAARVAEQLRQSGGSRRRW